jgi:hypothetical protein
MTYLAAPGDWQPLDAALASRGLPPLRDRFAVLAYGANRNPATLQIKLEQYRYRSPGQGIALPALRGRLAGHDVVACRLVGQGYFYADLIEDHRWTRQTNVEAWVTLLDRDQLRAIHDSEGIRQGTYVVARLRRNVHLDGGLRLRPAFYAGGDRVVVSPRLQSPIAYSAIPATGRTLPAMTARAILDHLLTAFALRDDVARLLGRDDRDDLAAATAAYLNRQSWAERDGHAPEPAFRGIVDLINAHARLHALTGQALDDVRADHRPLSTEQAYAMGADDTFGALVAEGAR